MGKKVYVGNLPFSVDEDKLRELFSPFGEITEATVITDRVSGRSKGFAFVTFADDAAADKAIEDMDGKEVEGRPLKVSEARPQERRERRFGGGFGGGGFGRGRERPSW